MMFKTAPKIGQENHVGYQNLNDEINTQLKQIIRYKYLSNINFIAL